MLSTNHNWTEIVEVNPPDLPDMSHLLLEGAWSHVLVTDNVFGKIRVSPYAYSARVTHDVPSVHPTVVVSTRDRNILAIESEVRGALGNGVNSFLVVVGDTVPQVDHFADHYEVVSHLRELQGRTPVFEVGMPTRFQSWQFRKRIEAGAQFLVAGPLLDPATVENQMKKLKIRDDDPPVFVMVIPPFSPSWLERMESVGSVPAGKQLKVDLAGIRPEERRAFGWQTAAATAGRAREAGAAGVILMGLRFETVIDEAAEEWRRAKGRS
ncbi:MAG: methylenetetrahydrofolate reductase [Acidimicrobiia bacterium]|nr:methylenetetrahydrofolate reductase [Acidimicrobiia bacterium]